MALNLLTTEWIPVAGGNRSHHIAPWQITNALYREPVLRPDSPRPDFDAAILQFLIGLLQTAFAPRDEMHWRDLYDEPPSPETLQQAFEPLAFAFELDGEGPRFMQDLELRPEGAESVPISGLLIDSPGGQTLRNNADHFVKRGRAEALSPSMAALALLTLQLNAPSGGAGHRTSLRGGGPLTTLIAPSLGDEPDKQTLWHHLWLNVLPADEMETLPGNPAQSRPEKIFPWLAPTRTSAKGGRDTTPEDAHPLQMYWSMPRRIRLQFQPDATGTCSITGEQGPVVFGYVTKNYGVNYTGPWQHPLSPHYYDKEGMPLPMHPQAGGFAYRQWVALVLGESGKSSPARVVQTLGRGERPRRAILRTFGYDMANMKARCWYDSTFPALHLDEALHDAFTDHVHALVETADYVARNTLQAVRHALFGRPKAGAGGRKVSWQLADAAKKTDKTFFQSVTQAFWHRTEPDFFDRLDALHRALEETRDPLPVLRDWHPIIDRASQAIFDAFVLTGEIDQQDPRAIALANRDLRTFNRAKSVLEKLRIYAPEAA